MTRLALLADIHDVPALEAVERELRELGVDQVVWDWTGESYRVNPGPGFEPG